MEKKMAKSKRSAQTEPQETQAVSAASAAEAETKTTLEPVQLTIADLQLLSKIVDLASRRGAFQAGELSQVGDAYNKLTSFLAYVDSVQKSEAEAKGETAGTEA
jgi:hypothetical protein